MEQVLTIPFEHLDRKGTVKVVYQQNPGPVFSGLDAIKGLNFAFDLELCKLYPTIHVSVEQYDGTGIRGYMAWIQFTKSKHWLKGNHTPLTGMGVDMAEDFRKLGIPFYSYGNNPAMHDCPCYNLNDSEEKLEFVAETFLVTFPGRWNGKTVSFLAGVRWGYEEFDVDGVRKANIYPIEQLDGTAWNDYVELLREQFPTWNYGEFITLSE